MKSMDLMKNRQAFFLSLLALLSSCSSADYPDYYWSNVIWPIIIGSVLLYFYLRFLSSFIISNYEYWGAYYFYKEMCPPNFDPEDFGISIVGDPSFVDKCYRPFYKLGSRLKQKSPRLQKQFVLRRAYLYVIVAGIFFLIPAITMKAVWMYVIGSLIIWTLLCGVIIDKHQKEYLDKLTELNYRMMTVGDFIAYVLFTLPAAIALVFVAMYYYAKAGADSNSGANSSETSE